MLEVGAFADAASVADIGCSNGYLTNLMSGVCRGRVHGFDYSPSLLDKARSDYPHVEFHRADLNTPIEWKQRFDLVCCFETLEHAGDLSSALTNVLDAVERGGTLIVSVPIETGLWGIAKYCAKTALGYPLDEIEAGKVEYLLALLLGRDITRFRGTRVAWGTHYGFDWRKVEQAIAARMTLAKAYTRYATRIIVARNDC
jgi:2-polyprenyl-3-methyl-5-hydroxy-6-metoxy-1,4-benzoquinol methylase